MYRYLNRYCQNNCTEDDFQSSVEILTSNKNEDELNLQMNQCWNETTNTEDVPDLENTLYKIHYQVSKNENIRIKKQSLIHYFSRIAAILIFPITIALGYLLINYFSNPALMQTVSSPLASRTSFVLPDGSQVWLNAGSSISFPNHFSKASRLVKLSGEAYFDVKKDNIPFLVKTEKLTVDVLGTAFDVSAYPDEKTSVTLVRGKVSVNTPSGDKTTLIPGQQAFVEINTSNIQRMDVNPEEFISWKENILAFNNEPLVQVVAKLERWYNLKIHIADESMYKIHVTGTFKYEGVSEILELIKITESITYDYNRDSRTIFLNHK